jgi:type VI secretion system secreted protein Hcp
VIRFDQGQVIKGDSQNETYNGSDGWSELLNFNFGIENNANIGSISGGGAAGRASFKDIRLSKSTDSISSHLFAKCAMGQHFTRVDIVILRSGASAGGKRVKIMELDLRLVMVQEVQLSGSDGDDTVTEAVILRHGAQNIKFYTVNPNTGAEVLSGEATWSIVANSESLQI